MIRREIFNTQRRFRVAGKAITGVTLATTASLHLAPIYTSNRSDSSGPNSPVLQKHRPLRMELFSLSGALLGAFSGWWLASQTAQAYPLSTGGLPITDWPTQLIIALPCALSGAFLFTGLGIVLFHFSFHSAIATIHGVFSTIGRPAPGTEGIAMLDSNCIEQDRRQSGEKA